jgi:branched-chain amino acid transport system substrate-binding protein
MLIADFSGPRAAPASREGATERYRIQDGEPICVEDPLLSIRRFISLVVVAAFTFMGPAPTRADDNTIVFGAALAATGRDAREGALTKEGYEFWKDYVNAHGGIKVGGKTYKVDISTPTTRRTPRRGAARREVRLRTTSTSFSARTVRPRRSPRPRSSNAIRSRWSRATAAPRRSSIRASSIRSPCCRPRNAISNSSSRWPSIENPRPKTVAIVAANDLFSLEVGRARRTMRRATACRSSTTTSIRPTRPTYRLVVSAIKATNPDIILNGGHLQEALLLQRTSRSRTSTRRRTAIRSVRIRRTSARRSARRELRVRRHAVVADGEVSRRAGLHHGFDDLRARSTKKYGHVPDYHNAESTATCLAFQYAIEMPVRSIRRRCAMRSPRSTSSRSTAS